MAALDVPIRLLGPVGLAGQRPVTGAKVRAVLAGLALRAGQFVPTEQLIDDLWADDPPPTARNTVQVYVSAVRRSFEAVRCGATIERLPGGYRLSASSEQVDWQLFQALAAQGRSWIAENEHSVGADMLNRALGLWRGQPLADIGDVPLRRVYEPAMELARLGVISDRIDADLLNSPPAALIPELMELVRRHPLDERFTARLMIALCRNNQRAAALEAYSVTRHRIGDELGVEPGETLRSLHRAILADHPVGQTATGGDAPVVRRETPAPPRWSGAFVGRVVELSQTESLLRDGQVVTIVGPPGVGKSRLAAEVAGRLAQPCTFVRLHGVTGREGIISAIATALGLVIAPRWPSITQLRARLLCRPAVIVLDNCEHVRDECAAVAEALIRDRPKLRILATSTWRLDSPSESVLRLGPFPVPDPDPADPERLRACDAIRLFGLRSPSTSETGELTSSDAMATIARICQAVGGLPLAIELASARTTVMSLPELLAALNDQMVVLARSGSRASERHGSLRRAVALSVDLLDDVERLLFTRLSTFVAGFTLDAVEAMTDPSTAPIDLMQQLVDKSLVVADVGPDSTQFRMLEPLRQYAARMLDAAGADNARRRHVRYIGTLVAAAAEQRRGPRRQHWQQRLDAAQPDIEAAVDAALCWGDIDTALDLVACVWWRWIERPRTALRWYRRVINAAEEAGRIATARALPALLAASAVASCLSGAEAMTYARHALCTARKVDDRRSLVRAYQQVSDIAYEQGDLSEARLNGDAAMRLAMLLPDPYSRARCRLTVAYNHLAHLDLADAVRDATEAVLVFRAAEDAVGQADAQLVIAEAAMLGHDDDTALVLLNRIYRLFRNTDDGLQTARTAALLAWTRERQGHRADASALMKEALDIHLSIGHPWSIAHDLDIAAAVQLSHGRHGQAAAILGAAAAVRDDSGMVPMPRDTVFRARIEDGCRQALGPGGFTSAQREGRMLDTVSAIGFARAAA